MVSALIKTIFYRVLLPISLLVAGLLRPSFISSCYVFLALLASICPPIPKSGRIRGSTKIYLVVAILTSITATLAQLIYQVVDHITEHGERSYTGNCEGFKLEYWLIQLGLIRLPASDSVVGWHLIRLISPEIIASTASTITLIICSSNGALASNSSSTHNLTYNEQVPETTASNSTQPGSHLCSSFIEASKRMSDVLIVFLIVFVGIINPSILNLMYFISGITIITWWSLYTPLKRNSFNQIKVMLVFYSAFHFLLLFLYQVPIVQYYIDANGFIARVVGLTQLISFDCKNYWMMQFAGATWTQFVNFFVVVLFYHMAVIQYNWTRHGIQQAHCDNDSSVHEEDGVKNAVEMHNLTPDRPPNNEIGTEAPQDNTLLAPDNEEGYDSVPLHRLTSQVIDRQKISFIFRGSNTHPSLFTDVAQQLCYFVLYHSYVFALVAMLIWAMLYHSVFGLFFLVTPCVIFALYESRRWSFKLSPMLIIYGEFLLLSQYVYGMNLRADELPNEDYMKIIGFVRAETRTQAFVTLAIKIVLSLPLFALLRLHLREDYYDSLTGHDIRRLNYGTFDTPNNRSHDIAIVPHPFSLARKNIINYVSKFLSGAWIFVVVATLLFNSVTEPPVLYGIGYFLLWTSIISSLVISFPLFRRVIFITLTILIVYSSVVLITLYCYQFPSVPAYWKALTHLSDDWNRDIGLVNFKDDKSGSSLFARLSKPILLLIATMIQLKFFHRSWVQLVETPPTQSRQNSLTHNERKTHEMILSRLRYWSRSIYEVLWRIAELHIHRLVLFLIMVVATTHYCALNFIAVLLVVAALFIPSFNRLIMLITCGYLSFVFVARRIFVMHFIEGLIPSNASHCDPSELGINKTESIFEWIGFDDEKGLGGDLIGIIATLSLIGIQFAIQYRQKQRRRRCGLTEPPKGIIFAEAIEFTSFDTNLLTGVKVFLNYCFYKFGLEISLICMVYVAWKRMDFLASILLCWVLMFSLSRRSICRILWPFFLAYLAIELPLQYAMVLGLPTSLCFQYPWANLLENASKDDNLLSFLDLANYRGVKKHFNELILADFLLLMIAAAQWFVFKVESKSHPAGSNNSIYSNGDFGLRKDNPHYDYVAEQKSFIDYIKIGVFMYGHWVTLIFVLAAGLGGTSLFALGYLILAFWMLWQGTNLYTMRNYKRTLSRWYILCAYNVMAMLWKVSLQIIGCVFARDMDGWDNNLGCIIRQLFSIVCVDEASAKRLYDDNVDGCDVEIIETKIGLDWLAFALIIFQLRVLHSYLFQYVIIDIRCEIIQASRGAILINQLIEKQMLEQENQQQKLFGEIKKRMIEIRRNYEEQQMKSEIEYYVPKTYAQGECSVCESSDIPYRSFVNDTRRSSYVDEDDPFPFYEPHRRERFYGAEHLYHHAKRAGDYYMFEYDPRIEEDTTHPKEQYVPEVTPGAGEYDKLDPAQIVHTAVTKDMNLKETLDSVETAEKIKDEERRMIEAVRQKHVEPKQSPKQRVKSKEKRSKDPEVVELTAEDKAAEEEQPENYEVQKSRLTEEEESSSSDGLAIDICDEDEERKKHGDRTIPEYIVSTIRFGWKMCTAALDYLSAFFDRHSREHRYVAFVLDEEKKHLKFAMSDTLYAVDHTTESLRSEWKSRGKQMVSSAKDIDWAENAAKNRWERRNVITKFMISCLNFLMGYSHILCYFFACVAHSVCGGLLTLPLPLMVFFWGTLCNPRPPKLFWIAMISWTELIIVVKFIFQFGFYPWNKQSEVVKNSPQVYKAQYVLGVQKMEYFAVWDVILLIALFLHRYMLRRIGLWKDANVADTFANPKRSSANSGIEEGAAPSFATEQQPSTSKQVEEVEDEDEEKRTGFNRFFFNLTQPRIRYIRDLYPIMFFLDIFCMLILVFKYNQFGESSSNSSILLGTRIPIMFVFLIFVLLVMIVLDRALYLRKSVKWKLVYQLFTISLLHIWIFGALPGITKTEAAQNRAAGWLYVFKCLYLVVSAWQIRNGYPKFSTGNLLTHSYGLVNYVLFYVFMFLPLVLELRTIIDWTWTETTMPIFDFIKMEVIYSKIYLIKCARKMESNFPAPRGQPRGKIIKLMYGIPAILAIILLVLSPLLTFALLNRIGAQNKPQRVDMTVGLEGYPPIYIMSSQGLDLDTANSSDIQSLTKWFSNPAGSRKSEQDHARMAISFINDYTTSGIPDLIKIRFRPESDVFWSISSESLDAMQQELKKSSETNVTLTLKVHLEFLRGRDDDTKEPVVHSADYFIPVAPRSKLSDELREAIKTPGKTVDINNALPYYLIVPNEGKIQDADILLQTLFKSEQPYIRNQTYSTMRFDLSEISPDTRKLWTMQFNRSDLLDGHAFNYENVDYGNQNGTRRYIQMVAFVDRLFPSFIAKYTQGGLAAAYLAIVYFAARILRSVVATEPLDVILTEMPNADYVHKICLDIYLVREAKDFILEEDLFAKLIFLFRSPDTLIKWTRCKMKQD